MEEYVKTLKDFDKNMQDIKQRYQIAGITAGMDAQVKVKPRQGPLVGDGTGMSRGSTLRHNEMESKFETLLMECITKHEIKLANTFWENWEPTRARTSKLDYWKQSEQQLQKWKIIDHIAVPIMGETRSTVARNCTAQNLTDHWSLMTYARLPQKKEDWRYENNSGLKGGSQKQKRMKLDLEE